MLNTIKKYLSLVDDILVDFLMDIKSLRYQLIILAFFFNIYILKLISENRADYKLAVAGIGLLTLVYGMYFQSKKHQSQLEASMASKSEEPPIDRDPEA